MTHCVNHHLLVIISVPNLESSYWSWAAVASLRFLLLWLESSCITSCKLNLKFSYFIKMYYACQIFGPIFQLKSVTWPKKDPIKIWSWMKSQIHSLLWQNETDWIAGWHGEWMEEQHYHRDKMLFSDCFTAPVLLKFSRFIDLTAGIFIDPYLPDLYTIVTIEMSQIFEIIFSNQKYDFNL